mmetsp:Transcript_24283/g.52855  ORF Transcript_24283/g.52855 Transcript_24283/m.52855 type:complete len:239 (-) Transcript_24283:93-809(-)
MMPLSSLSMLSSTGPSSELPSLNACEASATGRRCPKDKAPSKWIRNSTSALQASNCRLRRVASASFFASSDSEGLLITSISLVVFFIMRSYSASKAPEMLKPPALLARYSFCSSSSSSSSSFSSGATIAGMFSMSVPLPVMLSSSSSPKTSFRLTFLPLYFFKTGTGARIRSRFSGAKTGTSEDCSKTRFFRLPAEVSSPSWSASAGSMDSGAIMLSAISSAKRDMVSRWLSQKGLSI